MRYDYPDASVATFRPLTEAVLAARLQRAGKRVRQIHGRHWVETRRGFFEPVHHLAVLSRAEVQPPRTWLGYRAVVDDASGDVATGSLPIHLIRDLSAYDEHRLGRDQRRYLRRLPAHVRVVQVTDDRIFRDQGYHLLVEWCAKRGLRVPTRRRFVASMRSRVQEDGWLVLAALNDDRLLGYIVASVVDGVGYLEESKVSEAGSRLRVGLAMDHACLLAFKRSALVTSVTVGLHEPEFPSRTDFKVRQGFPVIHVPTASSIRRPIRPLLQRLYPLQYYRWTGSFDGTHGRSSGTRARRQAFAGLALACVLVLVIAMFAIVSELIA